MPTTAHGLPYPGDTIPPDVPSDIQALAEALDERTGYAVRKAATQQVVNSAVMVNDLHLKANLAVGVYRVEAFLHVQGAAAGDIKVQWLFGGTLTPSANSRTCIGPGTTTTGVLGTTAAYVRQSAHGPPSPVTYGLDGTNISAIHEDLLLSVDVAGLLTLQWAQVNVSTTPTVMETTSRLYVTRMP